MSDYTLEDLVEETLNGKKPKKKRKPKKIKESETNVKEILGEAEEEDKEEEPKDKKDDAAELDSWDATAEASKEKAKKREPKGDLVMTVNLSIDDEPQGKMEIGAEEYLYYSHVGMILDLYEIKVENIKDPDKSSDKLELTVAEEVSNSEKNTVRLFMAAVDNISSITVLVNEMQQPFTDINQAIQFFDQQYQNNILNIINKEVHA
jgi:hypothetical protein